MAPYDPTTGDSYEKYLRVISMHSRTMFCQLEQLSLNLDFRLPIFEGRGKRNRSLGSVQALLVELMLTDEDIRPIAIKKLKQLMINAGKNYEPSLDYTDAYNIPLR
jgi:hypothetical protein